VDRVSGAATSVLHSRGPVIRVTSVAALVGYRTGSRHPGSRPSHAQADGRAAIRCVREHATEIHADPARLIVIGAGSGANIAGAALLKAPVSRAEAPAKPSDPRPDAGVLLSAIFDGEKGSPCFSRCGSEMEARQIPLPRLIGSGAPPMLVIHGNAGRLVPVEDANAFGAKMERKRNPFRLLEFEGRDREFFQFKLAPVSYEATLAEIDRFPDEHDLIKQSEGDSGLHVISWREGDFSAPEHDLALRNLRFP
jgi:acetyl esterase/lipase